LRGPSLRAPRADIVVGMVRRVQQGQQKLRKARREAAEKLESDEGAYRPDRRNCVARQWETAGDDSNTIRVQNLIWYRKGQLVDFVVNLQVLTSEGWQTVEYADCCHGNCHYHPQSGNATRPILRLDVVGDVQNALRVAQPLIYERLRIIRG
jgi:hypothetical protein